MLTIVVNILTDTAGQKVNTTSTLSSNEAPVGAAATATILVLPADAVQVGYAANLGAGDSVVNLTSAGTVDGFDPAGDICANVYVFAEDQQLIACCTCPLTPNHLKTLSAQKDLISNTLTPGVPIGITTMLVASYPGPATPPTPGHWWRA